MQNTEDKLNNQEQERNAVETEKVEWENNDKERGFQQVNKQLKEHNLMPALILQAVAIYGAYANSPTITLVCGALVMYIIWIKPIFG